MLGLSCEPTLGCIITLGNQQPHKWDWHLIFSQSIRYMSHFTCTLLYICSSIQCEILTYTWHVIISPVSVRLLVCVINHQEPLSLHHNVESEYDIIIHIIQNFKVHWRKINHISENDITYLSKILSLKILIFSFYPIEL